MKRVYISSVLFSLACLLLVGIVAYFKLYTIIGIHDDSSGFFGMDFALLFWSIPIVPLLSALFGFMYSSDKKLLSAVVSLLGALSVFAVLYAVTLTFSGMRPTPSSSNPFTDPVPAINFNGEFLRTYLLTTTGPGECGDLYYIPNFNADSVRSTDGTMVRNPGPPCGFGKVRDLPTVMASQMPPTED